MQRFWPVLIALTAAWVYGVVSTAVYNQAEGFFAGVAVNWLRIDFMKYPSVSLLVIWVIPMALVGVVAFGLAAHFLKVPAGRETRCRRCGYILRGISEPRCPECGERI